MKILLVQTSFLGDVILSTPLIENLKILYPEAELWVMATPEGCEILKFDPEISGLLPFDKHGKERGIKSIFSVAKKIKKHNFAAVYSLHRSFRTALVLYLSGIRKRIAFKNAKLCFLYTQRVRRAQGEHEVLRNLSLLGEEPGYSELSSELRLVAPPREQLAEPFRRVVSNLRDYYVLVPGSAWATKRWHWQYYRKTADILLSEGKNVVLAGSREEVELADRICANNSIINLVGKTSLGELLFLIKNATIVLCNDSMALHIASSFKVQTVAVFCSTVTEFGFGPWKSPAVVLGKDGLPCRPCGRHGHDSCPNKTEACMKGVSVQEVIRAVSFLRSKKELAINAVD